jgi:uncharacterized protein YlzI (FlbEa/FlbD family)
MMITLPIRSDGSVVTVDPTCVESAQKSTSNWTTVTMKSGKEIFYISISPTEVMQRVNKAIKYCPYTVQ